MRIENIKRWQWVIIGALLGLAVAHARVSLRDNRPVQSAGSDSTMEETEFFSLLARTGPPPKNEPILTNIVIYPRADGKMVVGATELKINRNFRGDVVSTQLFPRCLVAPSPYVPLPPEQKLHTYKTAPSVAMALWTLKLPNPAEPRLNVVAFLSELQKANPKAQISFRRIWWYEAKWIYLMFAGGGILVIGGIWPFIVNLLVGWGFGRPPEEKGTDLSKVRSKPAPEKPKGPAVTQEDMDQLRAMEAQLEASLKGSGEPHAAEVAATATPVPEVKKLTATKLEVQAPRTAEEERAFQAKADDFYPVERRTAKKKE